MYVYITSLKTNKTGPREKLYKRHDSLVILYIAKQWVFVLYVYYNRNNMEQRK